MNAESIRAFLLTLPHVVETRQWGDNLLFWVGDKAIGGKMFALVDLDKTSFEGLIAYPTHPERFAELVEIEGIAPAKYLARLSWVSVERWDVFRTSEWQDELRTAHTLKLEKLPPKVRAILALPAKEQKRHVAEGRKRVAEWEAKEVIRKAAKKKAGEEARKVPLKTVRKPAKKRSAK